MKRFLIFFTVVCMCLCSVCTHAAPLYTYKDTVQISRGVTLTRINDFYANHQLSYSVIKADISDKANSIKLLTPQNGIDRFATVENLAKTEKDTVAALNADFFSVFQGSKGFSLGIEIKDGDLLQSPINPSTMASVYYDDNTLSMSYLDFHIMAVAPNGQYQEVRHLNKHTSYFGDILMYTSDVNGGYSPAPGGDVVEVVVEDGIVKEFRRKMPAVKIPDNGCVLVVSEGSTMFLANNFKVGDKIKFDYYITPDISDVEAAFGGGAMLVSEGKALTSFSHNVSGYHPRSAIGVDKSGKTAYLVAVDGRQSTSRGMTMTELAELMASLGCYTAVNLDGGGSTAMVASTVWDETTKVVNSPSENRNVSNAVGIITESGDNIPHSVAVKSDREIVFVGDYAKITTSVLNQNLRPVDGKVTLWSDQGKFNGNYFSPSVGGKITVHASCNDAYGFTEFYAIDKISGIKLNNYIHMPVGGTEELQITVFDSEGRNVAVDNTIDFYIASSNPGVVSVKGRKLTAHKSGKAVITVNKDNAVSYASVIVGNETKNVTDGFDTLNGKFISYPSYVGGSVKISSSKYYSGKTSLKLAYDFSADTTDSKAAYYAPSEKIKLDNSTSTFSVKCFSPQNFAHSVRAMLTDGNGNIFRLKLGEKMTGGSWHTLSATIPSDITRPVSLDRIYALYTNGETKDSGYIYFDDLTYSVKSEDSQKYPASPANVYDTAAFAPSSSTFRIGSLDTGTKTVLTNLTDSKMIKKLGEAKSSMLMGNLASFSKKEDNHALYVTLDTSKGGIKATDASQWNSLANAMAYSNKKNVFIISDNSLFGNDAFENSVIRDYLGMLNKNIFVITGGERNTYRNINGVGYFTVAKVDKEENSAEKINNYACLEFSLSDNPTFRWVKLY